MNADDNFADASRRALDRADRAERRYKLALLGAVVWEAALLALAILVMDFGDRVQLLILICALLVYGTLALGAAALGAHVSRVAARILKAIESSG